VVFKRGKNDLTFENPKRHATCKTTFFEVNKDRLSVKVGKIEGKNCQNQRVWSERHPKRHEKN